MRCKYGVFICFGSFLFLIGCATQLPVQKQDKPGDVYREYIGSLSNSSDEDLLVKYWSHARVAEGMDVLTDDSEDNKLNKNAIVFSIRFPNEMKNILSMEQNIKGNTACLLVTGATDTEKKLMINIPYLLEDNTWKINEVFIKYLEDDQPVPTKPDCTMEIP
ncbi:MAG: hypothetical protein GXP18_12855 [Gammaproteobacteria bacterium]|nr:hypothetical protein [Gammaproteobacteria bacterium]